VSSGANKSRIQKHLNSVEQVCVDSIACRDSQVAVTWMSDLFNLAFGYQRHNASLIC
jgi:hypothetical protein